MLKNDQVKGSIIIFILCIGLNVVCSYICPDELWRLLVIRYLPLSVIGWIWLNAQKLKKHHKSFLIFMGGMSLFYLLFWAKYDYSPLIYYGSWNSQNYPVYFWTLILVVLLMKMISDLPEKVRICLSWLGNNSWFLFLAQMFFISCVSSKRFPTIYNEFITQIIYVCFVFIISIGSVFLINLIKKSHKESTLLS